MAYTKVEYEGGVISIRYPSGRSTICEDISEARIVLESIMRYRENSSDEKKFFYYAALADRLQQCIDQMTEEEELKQYGENPYAAHASC